MTDSMMSTRAKVARSMKKRRAREMRFRAYGMVSVLFGLLCLLVLFGDILSKGTSAFRQTVLQTEVFLDTDFLGVNRKSDTSEIFAADFDGLVKQHFRDMTGTTDRRQRRELYALVSAGAAWEIQAAVVADPELLGQKVTFNLLLDDEADQWFKHHRHDGIHGSLTERQLVWLQQWAEEGKLITQFNKLFFTNGDSREPELAGIRSAITGTFLTLLVTLLLSFPIGVAAAIYLEEFAPRNKLTDFIEININNLAAVPSIIFGLLGLAIFIGIFGVSRSTPLVGGLVLTLMTLPTIIISGRAAIKAVPPSIREAAYGLGASKMQVVFHHVLPLALPGMLTGTIIGMAQALGETAPLLMIGMVAFVVDVPGFITDPSTVLPVQIFLWADSPERAFMERTSGAIMVLLGFLIAMNTAAVMLRRRLERRW